MSLYVAQLNAAMKADQDRRAEAEITGRAEEAQAARERLTPLENRLARLLSTIPIEVQRDGLSLPALQTLLKGRSKGSCHPGDLGDALRKLGWTRRRCWNSGPAGFSALWYPLANKAHAGTCLR